MLAEIDLDNPNHVVYPRSYAHVTLELIRHPDALSLPAAAVQRTGSVAHVLLVHNGRVTEVPVSTALESDSYIEITSGLNAGDLVVSTFNSAFTNGEEVRVDRAQMAASPPGPIHASAD